MNKKPAGPAKTKLDWDWKAFILGPIYYAMNGMWKHALVMVVVLFLGGFIMFIPIAVFSALRFQEDLQDFHKPQKKK